MKTFKKKRKARATNNDVTNNATTPRSVAFRIRPRGLTDAAQKSSCEMICAQHVEKGVPAAVVLSHSARLNAKKFARVTDETHPAKLGRPAGNYNVSRHYDAGKRNRFSCDFRRDRIRSTSLRGNSLLRDQDRREILIGLLSCERVILGFIVFLASPISDRRKNKKFIPMKFQSCRKINYTSYCKSLLI